MPHNNLPGTRASPAAFRLPRLNLSENSRSQTAFFHGSAPQGKKAIPGTRRLLCPFPSLVPSEPSGLGQAARSWRLSRPSRPRRNAEKGAALTPDVQETRFAAPAKGRRTVNTEPPPSRRA